MMSRSSPVLLALCLACLPVAARAAPPEVKHLFPAGATRGTTATVSTGGKLGDHRLFAWCNRDDVRVERSTETDRLAISVAADAPPGVAWLRLYNVGGASALRPFVIGLHPEFVEAEPNNALKEAQPVDGPIVVANGQLSGREDVDTFAVPLRAGQTLVASLTANRIIGSPMDGVLQLVSPAGFVLEQNDDDYDLDPRIVFTAPAEGTYFVRTFAFPSDPNQSIRFHNSPDSVYRLTLSTGPFADYAWPLAVSADSQQHVELVGWNLGDNFRDVALTASGTGMGQFFDPRLANTTVTRILPHPAAVEASDSAPAMPLDLPVAISGRIANAGQIDEYVFNAGEGQMLEFQIESRELGFPLDPVLALLGPDGKMLRETDDAANENEDVTLAQQIGPSGQYRLRIEDRFGHGGTRYVYLLTAGAAQPSCTLSVTADAYTLAADQPLEIEVTVNRTNGYAGALTITAVDLPAGVTVTPAVSSAEGDTSKAVKLVLTAGAGIDRPGPFRIVGTPADAPSREIIATATLPKLKAQVSQLWLSVPNPQLPKLPVEAQRPA